MAYATRHTLQEYKGYFALSQIISGAYAGFLKGGGPNFKISGIFDIHAAKRMSRAAKLRAFVRGVWGHAPPRKFFKMVQFRAFWGLISTTFMVKNPLKKL